MDEAARTTNGTEKRYTAGLDLHRNNTFVVVQDETGKKVVWHRVKNQLPLVDELLTPYREQLAGVAVESTYNWQWLVDGLQALGYPVQLAHSSALVGYPGQKHTGDGDDAADLCRRLRHGELPPAYIYPAATRGLRDALRRRMGLVQHRTAIGLSLLGLLAARTGSAQAHGLARALAYDADALRQLLTDPHYTFLAGVQQAAWQALDEQVRRLEAYVLEHTQDEERYAHLQTIPGIGPLLGLVVAYETGEITRFPDCGHYCSYCRGVPAARYSNERKKANNNRRNGNVYLAWAYLEAATKAHHYEPLIQHFYDRKLAQRGLPALALKAVAAKLSKGAYFVMRDNREFNVEQCFA